MCVLEETLWCSLKIFLQMWHPNGVLVQNTFQTHKIPAIKQICPKLKYKIQGGGKFIINGSTICRIPKPGWVTRYNITTCLLELEAQNIINAWSRCSLPSLSRHCSRCHRPGSSSSATTPSAIETRTLHGPGLEFDDGFGCLRLQKSWYGGGWDFEMLLRLQVPGTCCWDHGRGGRDFEAAAGA